MVVTSENKSTLQEQFGENSSHGRYLIYFDSSTIACFSKYCHKKSLMMILWLAGALVCENEQTLMK